MDKTTSLTDFLKDLADAIRFKTNTTAKINPQNFSALIRSIKSASSSSAIQVFTTKFGNDIY